MYRSLLTSPTHSKSNLVFSPLSASSSLAMLFLGARGSTSWQINELLRLDEMISFNPHLLYKNVTESLAEAATEGQEATAACVKQMVVGMNEDPLIEFYKARAAYFYGGTVSKADFSTIDTAIRDATDKMVSMKTGGKMEGFSGHDHPRPEPPLAMFAANYFKVGF